MTSAAHPDRRALAKIGAAVRERLASDPGVRRLPEERAEVYTVEGFLQAAECAHLISMIDAEACPSILINDRNWPDYRTSYSSDINLYDMTVRALDERLNALTGLSLACSESAQGQRYQCGQYFREHCDWFDTRADYWKLEKRCGGQRSWTAMVYLNSVDEGGTTDFPRVQLSIAPLTGCLLLWNNAQLDGTPNPWTSHAARPVMRGVKYVVTKWFRAHTCR